MKPDTVQHSHFTREESIKVFNEIEHELKASLRKTRHDHDSTYTLSLLDST